MAFTFKWDKVNRVFEFDGLIHSNTNGFKFPDGTIQTTAATGGGGGGYSTIENLGGALTQRSILNFAAPFTAVDNGGALRTDVSIAAGAISNSYLTNSSLTVSAGTGLSGGGSVSLGGTTTLSLPNVGTAGTYTLATGDSLTTDTQGRVSAVSTVTRTLTAGTGLTGGGTLAADRTFSIDQAFSPTWTGSHTFSNNIVIPATPTLSTHAASKSYVDSLIQGLDPKAHVIALSSTNIASLSGTTTIDGVSVVASDRVLLTGQTTASQNGIWVVSAGAWTRPSDFAAGAEAGGAYVLVLEGTLYADTGWLCTTDPPNDVIGTNNLTFAQFSGAGTYTAGSGLTLTGTQFSIGSGQVTNAMLANSSLTVTAGTGLSGGGSVSLGGTVSLSLPNVGTAGTYSFGNGSITTDAQGRVSSAVSATNIVTQAYTTVKNSAGTAQTQRSNLKFGSDFTVTDSAPDTVIALTNNSLTVTAGTGLSGGGSVALGGTTTLSLPNVGTPGTYALGAGSITTDTQGRVSSITATTVGSGTRTVDSLLTGTTQTTVATYTPATTKGLWVGLYYRVVTATTNITIDITYTDPTGAQTLNVIPITATATGSYALPPIFLLATSAAVAVKVTAGAANQIYVTASIVEA